MVPDLKLMKYRTALRIHAWDRAVDCWVIFPKMRDWLWHIVWNYDVKLDVVTFNPEGFGESLAQRFDRHQLPVNHVLSMEADELARQLAHMLDVKRVFFGNPQHQFKYGSRGQFVERHGIGFDPR